MQYLVEQCVDLTLRSCIWTVESINSRAVNASTSPTESTKIIEIIGPRRVDVSKLKISDYQEELLSSFINKKIGVYNELLRVIKNSAVRDKFQITYDVAYKVRSFDNINEQMHDIIMSYIFKFVSPSESNESNEIHVVRHVRHSENISGFSLTG